MTTGFVRGEPISQARLIVELCSGEHRRLGKLVFSQSDTSLYILPPPGLSLYRCGFMGTSRSGPTTINLDGLTSTEDTVPKLSVHETGRAHITIPDAKPLGPLWTTPLFDFRGEHAASITADRLDLLPRYSRVPKMTGSERDIILRAGGKHEACDVIIYANGMSQPEFVAQCQAYVHRTKPYLRNDLYLGFRVQGRPVGLVPAQSDVAGVTVIGAWRRNEPTSPCLLIRGTRGEVGGPPLQ